VPDAILEQADEVELIDISPEELLQRLKEGKVYLPAQAERALASFFTRANLTALRELALRRTAQQVDTQLQAERALSRTHATWPTAERIVVCVSPSPLSADLVRAARRLAAETHAEWEAVYVETAASRELPPAARERLAETLRLAEALGGAAVSLAGERVADAIVAYARQRNATKILAGKPTHAAWLDRLRGSLVDALIRQSGDIDIYVVRAQAGAAPQPAAAPRFVPHSGWPEYLIAACAVAVATGVAFLLRAHLQQANLVMLYLLAVVAVALRTGRGPSMLAALLAVGAFDFCFVTPYYTFAVRDAQYLITFLVMLLVSLVIANLTHRMKQQVQEAVARERRASSLYQLGRELAATSELAELVAVGERRVGELFHAQAAIVLAPADGGRMELAPRHYSLFANARSESAVMQWVRDNGKPAGHGTATLPGAEALHLPLSAGRDVIGVLALKPGAGPGADPLTQPEQRHLLDTCAALVALALERAVQQQAQEGAQLQAERERLRSTLLSSISHDLRTPLAGISGSAETLLALPPEQARAEQAELLGGIKTEAQRLSLLLENILDLTRVESGALSLRLEVQPLEEVVGSALGLLERRLAGREVALGLPADLPLVRIDAVLVERVLVNLLDNALKYTPAGSPLELSARGAGAWVEVSLADRGPGLPPLEPEQLFGGALQGGVTSGPAADASRGTGLGLSICKALVEAHGGAIRAAPRPGGGSVFSFTLPAAEERAAIMEPA
jgi:two-component system sensor histidine kinase KdpD